MVPARRRFIAGAGALTLAACAQLPTGEPAGQGGLAAPQRGFQDVNGTRLYYEVAGAGQPVVLLHGFTFDTRMWDDQFAALAKQYRVIRYDARGFGRSALPRAGEPYSQHEDLAALLDRLDARRAHVVGQSMGGRFALDYALQGDDRLRSLTLIDAVIGGYGTAHNWPWSRTFMSAYQPVIDAGKRKDVAMAKAAWLAHPLFAPAREQPVVAARLRQMVEDYSGWHFINPDPARLLTPPAITQLAKIQAPTLALVGERDLVDFHRMADEVQHGAKHAVRRTIPRVGHLSNMEAPGEVNAMLLEFLASR
jgi:3-oxoadipate enol-lactonase